MFLGLTIGAIQASLAGLQLARGRDDLVAGRFQQADAEFTDARDGLHHNPLLGLVGLVPAARRQVDALELLADMGARASHAARLGVAAVRGQDLGRLRQVQQELARLSADRARIPSAGLAPPIRQAVAQFDRRYAQAAAALPLLPLVNLLVGNGTASYLVMQQDPAELRPTGGFIGSVAFLDFDHGTMRPFNPVDVEVIDGPHHRRVLGVVGAPNYVPPPAPLRRVLDPGDSWELRDENFSPDFPTSARLAESLLQRETGRRVQGVIAVDPYLVADLLTITGPVRVPQTGDVLTAQNFFETTLRRVELHRGPTPRKSFLTEATGAVLDRFKTMPAASWSQIPTVLEQACRTKHVQAYFDDPAAEAVATQYGCGGQVPVFRQDGLLVVDTNLSSNKDDFWISRSFRLNLDRRSDGVTRHTLSIAYGPYPSLQQLTTPYYDWLRVYLPSGARLVAASGVDQAVQSAELGNALIQGWVQFDSGQTRTVSIVYDLPSPSTRGDGGLELQWLKQAGRDADPVVVSVAPSTPAAGATVTTDLRQDRLITSD